MKNTMLAMAIAAISSPLQAQTSGKISYDEKIKLEIRLDGAADESIISGLPKEKTLSKVLHFSPETSVYIADKTKQKSDEMEHENDGERVVIKMKDPDDKVYCNLKNHKRIEQRDFMSRMFLVESDLQSMEWKMTGNQKMILGYPCQEALLKDTSKKVTAWFTSAIPVSTGPNGYANLPGVILAADIDNGKIMINATAVELKEAEASLITKPREGKKVTKTEFEKIKEQKRKEMEEQYGGGGNVIIKIKNN